jgi:hypothetical protein
MSDVVDQRKRFHQVLIQGEYAADSAGDLGNFDRMGQPVAKVIGNAGRKDLRFGFETPESAGMNHAVAIALEGISIGVIGLGVPASAALRQRETQRAKSDVGRHPKAA